MAGKVKGITVEIGGNVTGLNKALEGTNKQISSTQSELKKVEKLLKLDPTNTELLKQKQELLAKSIGETKNKLETLKDAEKQAQQQFREGKISKQQYSELKREIVATEQSLQGLKEQAKTTNSVMQKIGKAAGDVAEKTKGLSLAAGGALVGLGAAAVKAGQNADDLNTLAKQTGLTTAELQKMQYASDIVDVSVESITGALKKMKKNMDSSSVNTQEAWARIGVSATNADGSMRNATDVFYDALGGLSKIANETERDQIAMTLFGKSADELAGIVDDGGASLKQLGQEAEDAGLILSQDALDSANEFNDSIDKLKASAAGSFGKIANQLATLLIPALEKLCGIAETVLSWFTNLSPAAKGIIITVIALVAAISPLASIVQTITVLTGALTAIKTAHAAATAVETAATTGATAAQTGLNLAFLACPLTWIVLAIMALVAAFIYLWNNCESFRNFWISLWEGIKSVASAVGNWLKKFFTQTIPSFFNSVVDFFKNLPSQALGWGKDFIQGLIDGIKKMIGKVTDAVKGVAEKIKNFLHFSVPDEGPLTDYESWMPDFMQGLADGINKSKSLVTSAVKGLATDVNVGMNLNPAFVGVSNNTVEHKGTIRIEGVSNDGEYYNAKDIIMDDLRRESRL